MNITFQFESLNDFLWMSGHGPYVWSSVAIMLVGFIGLSILPRLGRKRLIKEINALAKASKRKVSETN